MNKKKAHFLHIGKTGGTAVKYALKNNLHRGKYDIVLHGHNFTLRDVPEGEKAFFFIREPSDRFVSGFYSRKRQGKPRYNVPWSAEEQRAFTFFNTPNKLGEALYSFNLFKRKKATSAMNNITHIKNSYWDWFIDEGYFNSRIDDILMIGFQENFVKDFEKLKDVFELQNISLPDNDVDSHKNPITVDKKLSNKAVKNLKKWYKDDYKFINLCKSIKI